MRGNRGYIFLLLLSVHAVSFGVDLTRVNVAWQYDPLSRVKVRHRIIQESGLLTVFLQFQVDTLRGWHCQFLRQADYHTVQDRALDGVLVDTLRRTANGLMSRLRFAKPKENLLVLKINNGGAFYYYDIWLKNGAFSFPSIYPCDKVGYPIMANYLTSRDVSWEGNNTYYAMGYREAFSYADPPMDKMRPLAPSIGIDTSFQFQNPVVLPNDYFYVVKKDSNDMVGVTVVKCLPYYPKFKQLSELVASMHYILNASEKKAMRGANNLRQSFDSFWLNTFKTKSRARNAIRNYFSWVEQANALFTDFKQGWKTDRGMLFIVYGVPDEVYRTLNSEEWYYDDGSAFEFIIIATFFSPRTYTLRRRVEFKESWFDHIAAICGGSDG